MSNTAYAVKGIVFHYFILKYCLLTKELKINYTTFVLTHLCTSENEYKIYRINLKSPIVTFL